MTQPYAGHDKGLWYAACNHVALLMFSPNTFLIGAQKSGTTYLASRLDQSPDVCVCDPKEPQFFSVHYESAAESYRDSFRNRDARITMDASTTYTFLRPRARMDIPDAPGLTQPVPERVRTHAPEARFIYIMRDPVDRAISAFRHNARKTAQLGGEMSLVAALEADPMLELVSRYADQIERWFEVFPRDRFLFLRFEDLVRDPDTAIRETCLFLGISPDPILEAEAQGEKHGAHALSPAGRMLAGAPAVKQALRRVVPRQLQTQLSERFLKRDAAPVTFTDRMAATERFAEDRARVLDLTGLAI